MLPVSCSRAVQIPPRYSHYLHFFARFKTLGLFLITITIYYALIAPEFFSANGKVKMGYVNEFHGLRATKSNYSPTEVEQ